MENKPQIKLNREKAKELCKIVIDAYENRKKLFSRRKTTDDMCPEKILLDAMKGSDAETKARWLFFACADMQQKDSGNYFNAIKKFYQHNPDAFGNESLEENGLFEESPFPFSYPVKKFTSIAGKLLGDYGGNLLKMINRKKNAEHALKKIMEFEGFGIKHSKMYLMLLAKHGLTDIDVKSIGPPIDTHFIKISYGCGVFDFDDRLRVDKTRTNLDKLYSEIVKEENIDSLKLNSGIWILGHKICANNNETSCKMYCPLDELCSKNFPDINKDDTRLYKKAPDRKNKNQGILPLYGK